MNEQILVTVNDQSLTKEEAREIARESIVRQGVPAQMADQYLQQAGDQLEKQAIEQFINQAVLKSEAEKRDEPVSDEEINEAMNRIEENLPEGVTLEAVMASQGVSPDALREDIVTSERVRKLFDQETADVPPASDADVEKFYSENTEQFQLDESVEARHILISCPKDADEETRKAARAEAEAIREALVAGEDFEKIAAEKSACPSGEKGGSLGRLTKGRVVPEFEKAAFTQEINEIGPVVETEFGFHVIQVTAKHPAGALPKEEVTEQIRENLTERSREEQFSKFVEGLREDAEIDYGKPKGRIIMP